tara:strand:+ start:3364 stop:3744 length:381 start_codon:yes stop_codon:yes gene_type:complete
MLRLAHHRAADFVKAFAPVLEDCKRVFGTETGQVIIFPSTGTGVRSDIGAVRQAMDSADHPALLFVDCVSTLASMPFEMDGWGVDIAVSGSQKGFMLTTGLAILGVSQKTLAAQEYYRNTVRSDVK